MNSDQTMRCLFLFFQSSIYSSTFQFILITPLLDVNFLFNAIKPLKNSKLNLGFWRLLHFGSWSWIYAI
jgi:hypothetical protein